MGAHASPDAQTPSDSPPETSRPKKPKRPCDRCGTFAKRRNVFGARLCAECVPLSLHPAALGPLTFGSVGAGALELARAVAWPGLLGIFAPSLATMVVTFVAAGLQSGPEGSFQLGTVIGAMAAPLVAGFVVRLAWDAIRRTPRPVSTVIAEANAGYWSLFKTEWLVGFTVGLYTLLLVIPGLLRGMDTLIAGVVTVVEERGPSDSMDESIARMRPHRGLVFGFVFLAGVVTIGALWLMFVTTGAFFVGSIASVLFEALTGLLQLFMTCLTVVLYTRERLSRRT